MPKKIENIPSPAVLMTSMRAIGYTFKTAIADIIDNSVSADANNIYITSPITSDNIFISILDDGEGMNKDTLLEAMKYGTGRDNYDSHDLGRFGLGLKSASLSQCRVLTVASKKDNIISAYQWNLDVVIKSQTWECLELDTNDIFKIPNIMELVKLEHGTLVIWQNFDTAEKKSNGSIRDYLCDQMDEAEKHISLVFHRFLRNKSKHLKIYINNREIKGLDPFLENHLKTDTQKPHEMKIENSIITVQPYILPYSNDLEDSDIKLLGGQDALRDGQGFYVYRNERLIVYGTWFRLAAKNISSELYKYGRIKVDIPNTLDDMWEIDIKKQNATIPKQILNNLKNIVSNVCTKSHKKIQKREKLAVEKDDNKIWNKALSNNNKDLFYINSDSNFIKNILDEFEDKDKIKIIKLLEIISSTIPLDDIYSTICSRRNETSIIDKEIRNDIIDEGLIQYEAIKNRLKCSKEKALGIIISFEPFNDPIISNAIKERVNRE